MKFFTLIVGFLVALSCTLSANEISPSLTVMVPMRDGEMLPTDLYLPPDQSEDLPCILLRSPAGRKTPTATRFVNLVHKGYMVAIQDTRNALDPEGKTFPYMCDGWGDLRDGYDTVEWLRQNPMTNGKVGTLGASALGITQLMMAPTAPKGLKCQYIGLAASSLYHDAIFPGGQLRKTQVEGWLGLYAKDPGVQCHVINQLFYNDFWSCFDSNRVADRVQAPAIHYGGWYDTFLKGTLEAFTARQSRGGEGARGSQKLLIGPWPHFWPMTTKLGDFEVPEEGKKPPIDLSHERWFEYYLKGVDNGIIDEPAVSYYVMGPFDGSPSSGNVWRHADSWPVPALDTAFYLTKDGGLSRHEPKDFSLTYSYEYDPHYPVPTLGGNNLFLEAGPKDQRPIEERDDVLVFTSEPLEEDLEVTGHVTVKLFFASDQKDTDVVVRLTDVYPDGRSILIADGLYRTGLQAYLKPENVSERQKPKEVEVDLLATSLVFTKGHSIRVSVSSSNYPRYERNQNIGVVGCHSGSCQVAHNTLYVGQPYLSRLILPIVRQGYRWVAKEGK